MSQLRAPPGYRFKPSDEVIIKYYLIPKIEGKPLPSDHIYETIELYGKEAQALEKTFHQGKEWYKLRASYDENFDDSLFFFTRLKKKWDNRSRISRIAGGGTWTEDNKGKIIYTDSSYKIKKTPFTCTDNAVKGPKKKMTTLTSDGNSVTWNMDEYSILKGEEVLDYVIVKIRRKLGKKECSSSASSKQALSPSKQASSSNNNQLVTNKAVDFAVKGGKNDFGVHGRVPELPSSAKVSRMQYQLPIGQCYVNTNYNHTAWDNGAGGRGLQHRQNSSISVDNVVPAAEDSHLKYQPSSSAATVQSISSSSVPQDVVFSTQQPMQSFGYPMYYGFPGYQVLPLVAGTCYQYPFLSGYQHKTVVPPRITDDQHEQKNSDNAAAQNHNQEGADDAQRAILEKENFRGGFF